MGTNIQTLLKADFLGTCFEPLTQLSDCPNQMHYIGNIPSRHSYKYITVVGSRAHSAYAKHALEHLIRQLAPYPVCIVSGLALGIDALAHRLAIQHGLYTVALPGSGLDGGVLYPASNKQLAREIVESGGMLCSEFDHDQTARQYTFPKRNRLMARIADLVLVVEASEKSGTLITARNALEYNVDVSVVPNTIFAEQGVGSNMLIKDGARPILNHVDILELLGIQEQANLTKTYDDVTTEEKLILEHLIEPLSREELESNVDLDVASLSTHLSLLEIKGHIKQSLGKIYKT